MGAANFASLHKHNLLSTIGNTFFFTYTKPGASNKFPVYAFAASDQYDQ